MPLEASTATHFETLRGVDEMEALAGEWTDLWEARVDSRIFQSPEWVRTWWKYFGKSDPVTIVFRADGLMIGVLPLFFYGDRQQCAALAGSGISDYLDILVRPGFEGIIQEQLAHALSQFKGVSFELHDLPADSVLLNCNWPNFFQAERTEWNVVMVLPLRDSLKESIPKPQFDKLLYYRRHLERSFAGTRIEFAAEENLDEFLSALIRLHSARWKTVAQPGVLDEPSVQSFHADLSWTMLPSGRLRLCALRVEEGIAAVFYGFADGDRTSFYLSGFDPAYSHFNLGTILIGSAIERAIEEGRNDFDFLRGAEPYKYSWGARPAPTFKLHLKSF